MMNGHATLAIDPEIFFTEYIRIDHSELVT